MVETRKTLSPVNTKRAVIGRVLCGMFDYYQEVIPAITT